MYFSHEGSFSISFLISWRMDMLMFEQYTVRALVVCVLRKVKNPLCMNFHFSSLNSQSLFLVWLVLHWKAFHKLGCVCVSAASSSCLLSHWTHSHIRSSYGWSPRIRLFWPGWLSTLQPGPSCCSFCCKENKKIHLDLFCLRRSHFQAYDFNIK